MSHYFAGKWITSNRVTNLEIYLDCTDRLLEEEYIIQHHQDLLPDWILPPKSIVFVFFQCQIPLDGSNLSQEDLEKQRSWQMACELGEVFRQCCQEQNVMSEVICPKTGYPLYSRRGSKSFHLSALITRFLRSFRGDDHPCNVIHPQWQKAVYPSLMLSSGSKSEMEIIIERTLQQIL